MSLYIIQLLHNGEEDVKIYSPPKNHVSKGQVTTYNNIHRFLITVFQFVKSKNVVKDQLYIIIKRPDL